jgi:hypothetical protein
MARPLHNLVHTLDTVLLIVSLPDSFVCAEPFPSYLRHRPPMLSTASPDVLLYQFKEYSMNV